MTLMTFLKRLKLFALLTAFFGCRLASSLSPTSFVLLKSSPMRRRKSSILLLMMYFLLWRNAMQVLWEDIPRLSPRKLARPERFSNLSHFRELWAESPEFRAICRDLGLIPVDFYHLFRVSDMKKRESLCFSEVRSEISRVFSRPRPPFIVEQLELF